MPAPRERIPTEHLDDPVNGLHWTSFRRYLVAAHRSVETINSYRQALADLTNFHPSKDLIALTKTDLQDYLIARLQRLAATTVAIRFRSLRAFYNWAAGEDIITVSPMAKLSEPKPDDVPPDIVSDADLIALLKACGGVSFDDRRDNAIIRLFCEPGSPRVAEMAGIGIDDVDMRNDRVKVTGKGRKTRWLPFGAKTGMALERYIRERRKKPGADKCPDLWVGAKAPKVGNVQQVRKMTTSGITKMLARRARQAGVGHIHPHQLRHTSANAWHDSGGSEGDAMELFGWSSPEMPRRYGRAAKTERAHRAARRASLGDRL